MHFFILFSFVSCVVVWSCLESVGRSRSVVCFLRCWGLGIFFLGGLDWTGKERRKKEKLGLVGWIGWSPLFCVWGLVIRIWPIGWEDKRWMGFGGLELRDWAGGLWVRVQSFEANTMKVMRFTKKNDLILLQEKKNILASFDVWVRHRRHIIHPF